MLNILIKPAGGNCDLHCKYCFYRPMDASSKHCSDGIMSSECAEALINRAFEAGDGELTFIFQGGEPTLAGDGFFAHFTEYAEKKRGARKVCYAIQTNGQNISDGLCRIFKKYGFLVGISADGCREVHDGMRGDGTFDRAVSSAKRLTERAIPVNMLGVISKAACENAEQFISEAFSSPFQSLQFIEYIPRFEGDPLEPSADGYAHFLLLAFREYMRAIACGKYRSVRTFDNYIALSKGMPPECCSMSGVCSVIPTVDGNGDVYPCDFYVTPEYRLGNIAELSFAEMLASDTAKAFLHNSGYIDPDCRVCPYLQLCRGGCRRMREPFSGGFPSKNRYCEAYRKFFAAIIKE